MTNDTPTHTNAHKPGQYKAVLPYPQTQNSARGWIYRNSVSIGQFARDHGLQYQALRDVLTRTPEPKAGQRLKAAIAVGLLPEDPAAAEPVPAPSTTAA